MFRLEKKFLVEGPPPPLGIARTYYGYAAGAMPLAFTQEDFLVLKMHGFHFFANEIQCHSLSFRLYTCSTLVETIDLLVNKWQVYQVQTMS